MSAGARGLGLRSGPDSPRQNEHPPGPLLHHEARDARHGRPAESSRPGRGNHDNDPTHAPSRRAAAPPVRDRPLAAAEPGKEKQAPLRTVPHVDLARYAGTWYEIASYPQRFQKGCTGTSATYTLRADGTVEVLNRCARDSLNGRVTVARGRAKVVDRTSGAKLKVSFFWPFWATTGSSISAGTMSTRWSDTRTASTSGS